MIPQTTGGVGGGLAATATSAAGAPTPSMPTAFASLGSRRATLSLSDLRTPLVENIMSMLPMGHDKALKYALYNVIALLLAAICIIAFWAAYCILEPFIVPLLWALLCGSVIHPFKDRMVTFAKEWIIMVKASSSPLCLQLVSIPFRAMDSVSEGIGSRVTAWWKYILAGSAGFFLTYLIYHNPPVTIGLILYWIVYLVFKSIFWIISWINGQFVSTLTVIYFGAIAHYVYGVVPVKQFPVRMSAQKSDPKEAGDGNTFEPVHHEEKPESESIEQPDSLQLSPSTTSIPKQAGQLMPSPTNRDKDKLMLKVLSVTTWALWFVYTCRQLPYPILLIVAISMITGSVVYIRKHSLRQRRPSHYMPYTAILALLGGAKSASAQTSRHVSRKGSLLQVQYRRGVVATPAPGAASATATPSLQQQFPAADTETPHIIGMKRVKPNLDLKISQEPEPEKEEVGDGSGCVSGLQFCLSDDNLPPQELGQLFGSEDEVDGLLDSNKFLYGVFCCCLVVQVWNRLWLVHLLPIPVIYYGLKRFGLSLGLYDYIYQQFYEPLRQFYLNRNPNTPGCDLFPHPVRVFFNIVHEADQKILSVFESYLDMVATIIIIVAVIIISVIFLIFVATQFYAEGDHLVRVGANVINTTVSQYPEISQLLPEGWDSLTGSLIGNAYHYGRDYIKTMIRDSVAERNPEKAEEMEKQVIELWDRVYISWNRTWGSLENVNDGTSPSSADGKALEWNDFVKTGQNVSDWFDTTMVVNYAKTNYGQVRAVLESIWTVLIGNVSLAISVITSIFSVLFGGGSALLNLIISFVVFFTALFYLLSSSTSTYKPVELFVSCFPGDGKHSGTFVAAIEESVSGVFSATMKMSLFYFMWTWLIHTLFQVNIVFVPSFFAAIFAAVPLLMPYWAVFPAVLELWLIQGQWTKALLMLLSQMAPMSLVDAQIYSEIKGGGHPYLTALAVAGGIFYFGFQGAIMGPVVLCFVFVAVKVGSTYMKEGTLDSFNV